VLHFRNGSLAKTTEAKDMPCLDHCELLDFAIFTRLKWPTQVSADCPLHVRGQFMARHAEHCSVPGANCR